MTLEITSQQPCCTGHDSWDQLLDHLSKRFPTITAVQLNNELTTARDAAEAFGLGAKEQLDVAERVVRNNLLLLTGEIRDNARDMPESHAGRRYRADLVD